MKRRRPSLGSPSPPPILSPSPSQEAQASQPGPAASLDTTAPFVYISQLDIATEKRLPSVEPAIVRGSAPVHVKLRAIPTAALGFVCDATEYHLQLFLQDGTGRIKVAMDSKLVETHLAGGVTPAEHSQLPEEQQEELQAQIGQALALVSGVFTVSLPALSASSPSASSLSLSSHEPDPRVDEIPRIIGIETEEELARAPQYAAQLANRVAARLRLQRGR